MTEPKLIASHRETTEGISLVREMGAAATVLLLAARDLDAAIAYNPHMRRHNEPSELEDAGINIAARIPFAAELVQQLHDSEPQPATRPELIESLTYPPPTPQRPADIERWGRALASIALELDKLARVVDNGGEISALADAVRNVEAELAAVGDLPSERDLWDDAAEWRGLARKAERLAVAIEENPELGATLARLTDTIRGIVAKSKPAEPAGEADSERSERSREMRIAQGLRDAHAPRWVTFAILREDTLASVVQESLTEGTLDTGEASLVMELFAEYIRRERGAVRVLFAPHEQVRFDALYYERRADAAASPVGGEAVTGHPVHAEPDE